MNELVPCSYILYNKIALTIEFAILVIVKDKIDDSCNFVFEVIKDLISFNEVIHASKMYS